LASKLKFGALLASAVVGATLVFAAPASASFHRMKVREVYAGGGSATQDYIELQMYASGENFTMGHPVQVYNAVGVLADAHPMPSVSNGANQATILIGDTGVAGAFGVTPDVVVSGLEVDSFAMSGAVCYPDGDPPDCVAWGGFTPQGGFPDPAAAGGANNFGSAITGSMSLTRRIDRGCPTFLEAAADDVGPSSTDFALTAPTPRSNSTAPSEASCGGASPVPPPPVKKKKCKKRKKSSSVDGAPAYAAKKKCKKKKRRR
jgi:hypothetical protein